MREAYNVAHAPYLREETRFHATHRRLRRCGMIGILLVAHSAKLAEGTADVLRNLTGYVEIASVGGVDPLGVSPAEVLNALAGMRSSYVLVFTDIGSSTLAALAALDLADEGLRGRVWLANAPFVEGAILAGIEAMNGDSFADCIEAAEMGGTALATSKIPTIERNVKYVS